MSSFDWFCVIALVVVVGGGFLTLHLLGLAYKALRRGAGVDR